MYSRRWLRVATRTLSSAGGRVAWERSLRVGLLLVAAFAGACLAHRPVRESDSLVVRSSAWNARSLWCEFTPEMLSTIRDVVGECGGVVDLGTDEGRGVVPVDWAAIDAELTLSWGEQSFGEVAISAQSDLAEHSAERLFLGHLLFRLRRNGVRARSGPIVACVVSGDLGPEAELYEVISTVLNEHGASQARVIGTHDGSGAVVGSSDDGERLWRIEFSWTGSDVALEVLQLRSREQPTVEEAVLRAILERWSRRSIRFESADR